MSRAWAAFDESSQGGLVAEVPVDALVILRAIAGWQELPDRVFVVLEDGIEQDRGDSQVRQVVELIDDALQIAPPEAALVACAILDEPVSHEVIRWISVPEFLDDDAVDDLILPTPRIDAGKGQGQGGETRDRHCGIPMEKIRSRFHPMTEMAAQEAPPMRKAGRLSGRHSNDAAPARRRLASRRAVQAIATAHRGRRRAEPGAGLTRLCHPEASDSRSRIFREPR